MSNYASRTPPVGSNDWAENADITADKCECWACSGQVQHQPLRRFRARGRGAAPVSAREAVLPCRRLNHVPMAPPLEQVHYVRHEIADLVWALERTALGANGPYDRGLS